MSAIAITANGWIGKKNHLRPETLPQPTTLSTQAWSVPAITLPPAMVSNMLLDNWEPQTKGSTVYAFDETYVNALRNRDDAVCTHFYRFFAEKIRSKLRAQLGSSSANRADDLVQEVFCAVFVNIDKGDPSNPAKLASYVLRITHNMACQEIKRLQRDRKRFSDEDTSAKPDARVTAEKSLQNGEEALKIRQFLAGLKPKYRRILIDLYYRELDRDTVCQRNGKNLAQLRVVIFRAHEQFRKRWEKR